MLAGALFACSGSSATATQDSLDASPAVVADFDASDGAPSESFPAAHPAPPQILKGTVAGTTVPGTVLTSPRIVPIVFAGDPMIETVSNFTAAVGSSAYWHSVVSEYGVGPATAIAPIIVDPSEIGLADGGTITFSNADTQSFIASHLDGAHSGWGTPDAQAIYAVFLPSGVTTNDNTSTHVSCVDFGGYHMAMPVNGTNIVYVVIPRCAKSIGSTDVTGPDLITSSLSHELIEAATDPLSTLTARDVGYAQADGPHAAYNIYPGGEIADMCSLSSGGFYKPTALGFLVQRGWSNASAAAGQPPCQPAPPDVIDYGAAPVLTANVPITSGYLGANGPTKGVKVPLGQSVTIEVDLYSNAPMSAPFNVQAFDLAGHDPDLNIVLDHDTGVNGDKIHATITRLKNGAFGGTAMVFIAYTSDTDFRDWIGFAAN